MDDKMTPNEELDPMCTYGMAQSPSKSLAVQLRLMMKDASPEDKCALCKAAEELEKPNNSWATSLPLAMLMLMLSTDFTSPQTTGMMQAYLEVLKKCNEPPQSEEEAE